MCLRVTRATKCPSSEPVSTMVPTPLFSMILESQVSQHSAGVGQLGAAQVDLVVRHHPDELKDLLPAGGKDKARAQHVVHAERLGRTLAHGWPPGDGFFGQKKQSRKTDLGVERSRNSDLGAAQARQAGGFYAGQVARPGGFYARQVARQGGYDAILEATLHCLEATMAQHWINNAQPGAANIAPLSLEGVSQMDSILPERLLRLSVQHLTSSCEGFEV